MRTLDWFADPDCRAETTFKETQASDIFAPALLLIDCIRAPYSICKRPAR